MGFKKIPHSTKTTLLKCPYRQYCPWLLFFLLRVPKKLDGNDCTSWAPAMKKMAKSSNINLLCHCLTQPQITWHESTEIDSGKRGINLRDDKKNQSNRIYISCPQRGTAAYACCLFCCVQESPPPPPDARIAAPTSCCQAASASACCSRRATAGAYYSHHHTKEPLLQKPGARVIASRIPRRRPRTHITR